MLTKVMLSLKGGEFTVEYVVARVHLIDSIPMWCIDSDVYPG